jgi:hypothetical protein
LRINKKIRELSKPLMSEYMFYGFDDLSDDYEYGREVYKEDVYETHSNMAFNYIKDNLYYLPFSGEKAEDMGGYLKYGRKSLNWIKYNVKLTLIDDKTTTAVTSLPDERERKLKIDYDDSNIIGHEVKLDLKKVDLFFSNYINIFRNCYFKLNKDRKSDSELKTNKQQMRAPARDQIAIPFKNIKVRIYIYRCSNLAAQDNCIHFVDNMAGYSAFCKANAFIELHLGDNYHNNEGKQVKYFNDVTNYVKNTLNPNFFKYFELDGDMPQDWKLNINVRSYNESGLNHSLIGSTTIDLEDRYLCDHKNRNLLKYKALEQYYQDEMIKLNIIQNKTDEDEEALKFLNAKKNKVDNIVTNELKHLIIPVESRPLYNPDKKVAQGMIEMYCEVLTSAEHKMKKIAKIEPPPPEAYELRLIIWETRDINAMNPVNK